MKNESLKSTECRNHELKECDSLSKECVGKAYNEFMYSIGTTKFQLKIIIHKLFSTKFLVCLVKTKILLSFVTRSIGDGIC